MTEAISFPSSEKTKIVPEPNTTYWNKQLQNVPSAIDLPYDYAVTQGPTPIDTFATQVIPPDTITAARLYSEQAGVSLSDLFFTVCKVLLYRYTHQTDLVAGMYQMRKTASPPNGKNQLRLALPIRSDLSGNPSFEALVLQVAQTLQNAFEHKSSLQSFLEEARNSAGDEPKLYEILFAWHDGFATDTDKTDFRHKHISPLANQQSLNLIFHVYHAPDRTEVVIGYSSKKFDGETITQLAVHFNTMLGQVLAQPQQSIANVDYISAEERHKILVEWNDTDAQFATDACIHHIIEEQARLHPNAIAIELYEPHVGSFKTKQQLTYAELDQRANQLAHHLQQLGAGPEVVIGIYMKRSLEMAISLLAILKSGAAYLPLDPAYPKERLTYIFKDSGISILLSQYKLIPSLPTAAIQIICPDVEWNTIGQYPAVPVQSTVTSSNICYVIYTSGSTGQPKGTLIMHRGVVNYLSWCIKAYQVQDGCGAPVNSSLAFDATVTSFLSPLVAGKKVLLLPEEGEIEALVDALQQQNNFSLVKITPAHLEILGNLLNKNNNEKQANALVIGGEALTSKGLEYWRTYAPNTRLINEYGPTETVVGCCIYDVPAGQPLTAEIPIGRPIANTKIYILDDQLQPVPIGVPGEIYIGGAGLARGYLNRPELTEARFIPNPFDTGNTERLYKTGDMARYLRDGNIMFLGRRDSQVKIRGYRIELGEIEIAMQKSGQAKQAVAVAKKENKGEDKNLVAYFVPNDDQFRLHEISLQQQWVGNWKKIYESEYGQTENDSAIDAEFNLVGWNDSFTGKPIPAPHMQEWLDDIVGTVLKNEPKNVLEIGCGTGLIYFQLAGKVDKYIGYDLSESSINQIKKHIAYNGRNYGHTELYTAPAHFVTLPPNLQVDTILLNSMVQYFPGEEYMNEVMDRCLHMIGEKGRIIIGDVRDNRLNSSFKAHIKLAKINDDVSIKEFRSTVEQDVLKEEELCLSPAYFYGLKKRFPQITHVDIRWKNTAYKNELSLYRFTVELFVGQHKPEAACNWFSWNNNKVGVKEIEAGNQIVAITGAPNLHLYHDRFLNEHLQNVSLKTVGELKQALQNEPPLPVELLDLLATAKKHGYKTKYLVHQDPFKINLVFEAGGPERFIHNPAEELIADDAVLANTPLMADILVLMQKSIKDHLLASLPKYMVPSDIIAIAKVPLTTNGKVDYAALPDPQHQQRNSTANYVAGRNKLEKDLAVLFGNTLGIKELGVNDNLFDLGLNSMQAYRVFAQVKKLTGKQLPLSVLIDAPNIEQLAQHLQAKESGLPWSSLVPIQPKGKMIPLYLVHAGAGTVLFYRELSLRLGNNQPVYGLQPVGLDGKQPFHNSVEEMARHYVKEIRAANPHGPYIVGGYCFGAVLAYEMAHQLISDGHKVLCVVNFNGVSPVYHDDQPGDDLEELKEITTVTHQNSEDVTVAAKPPAGVKNQAIGLLKSIRRTVWFKWRPAVNARYMNFLVTAYPFFQQFGYRGPANLRKYYFLMSNNKMVNIYQPPTLAVPLLILRSPGLYADPHLGWSKFATGTVITSDIPGHHIDRRQIMNEPFVAHTATELAGQIEKLTSS